MLTGAYRDLLPAIADCAAALTGLLFVAMTVARRHSPADRPVVIEQVRAAASILAFTNALAVSLFGLVPGNNIGYPAVVFAVVGIFFTAAGTRSIFSGHVPRQLALIALLVATFAFELAAGIALILHPHSADAAELVSNLLVGLLIVGIVRAWELVGDRATDIISSIAVLTGHDHNPTAHLQRPRPPVRPRPNQLATPDRWRSPGQTTARSELHLANMRSGRRRSSRTARPTGGGRRSPSWP
jgi:hypothetical protein